MTQEWELVLRLLIAAILGSLIGADRERLVWAAGLRTHMLVCVGACLFMIVSAFGFADILSAQHIILDPSRVAAQVVSGIGFLGAGSILLRGEVVRGLTTAASLWTVAAVGLAVGGGLYLEAVAATVLILVILTAIKPLEAKLQLRNQSHDIRFKAERGQMTMDLVNQTLGYRARRITRYIANAGDDPAIDEISITISGVTATDISEIRKQLKAVACVRELVEPTT